MHERLQDDTIETELMLSEIIADFSAPQPVELPWLAAIMSAALFVAGGVGGVASVVANFAGAAGAGAIGVANGDLSRAKSKAPSAERDREVEIAEANLERATAKAEKTAQAGRVSGAASAGTVRWPGRTLLASATDVS